MSDRPIGGGEILQYIGNDSGKLGGSAYEILLKSYSAVPYAKAAIVVLLLCVLTIIILRIFKIKSLWHPLGMRREIANVYALKQLDKAKIKAEKRLAAIVRLVSKTPFTLTNSEKEYFKYNLERADIKVIDGKRYMTPDEYNATLQIFKGIALIVGVIVGILANIGIGLILIAGAIALISTLPNVWLRAKVESKDTQIKENFLKLYLMMHYNLTDGGKEPIEKAMKAYSKAADNQEMLKFVDRCVDEIETHGEYNATDLITKAYKEIPQVGKLMRIIRQIHDGGETATELDGFKKELIKEEGYKRQRVVKKLVAIAKASFYVLYIILFQAIISAAAIYLPDLSSATSILGGR